MVLIYHPSLFLFILLHIDHSNTIFTPNTNDYDAYGSKIAMNDHFIVLAQNQHPSSTFFIQFSPYNHTLTSSSQCYIHYPNTSNTFIYTLAIGKKQNQTQIHFFFIGELINDQSGLFIGMATYNQTSLLCTNTSFSYSLQYFYNYDHQDIIYLLFILKVFLLLDFLINLLFYLMHENPSIVNIWDGNMTWRYFIYTSCS